VRNRDMTENILSMLKCSSQAPENFAFPRAMKDINLTGNIYLISKRKDDDKGLMKI
jgi:hypothetical protein